MPKSSKRFVLNNGSVNRYGFRILTEGMDISAFKTNPILLWMHQRPNEKQPTTLPIGHWQDIELANGELTAVPYFSDNDDFAMQIYHKVEEGTIRMTSVGATPIELSEDKKTYLKGQKLPTVTKSELLEVSIVDIGVNKEALALYHKGSVINLSEGGFEEVVDNLLKLNINTNTMNPKLMAIAIQLGLNADATEDQLAEMLTNKVPSFLELSAKNEELTTQVADLQKKVEAAENEAKLKDITLYLDTAVNAGKITEAQKPQYIKLASVDFDAVKGVIDAIKPHVSAQAQMATGDQGAADPLLKLSWDDAHKAGKLAAIKELYPEHYNNLYKEKYNKAPQGK